MRNMTAEKAATEIRRAYGTYGQTYVSFLQISEMVDLTKAEITAGVQHLRRTDSRVVVIPESNQKVLLPAERAAAIVIGNQTKHYISWQ